MHEQLARVAAEQLTVEHYVDDNMRNIPDHYHAHARPREGSSATGSGRAPVPDPDRFDPLSRRIPGGPAGGRKYLGRDRSGRCDGASPDRALDSVGARPVAAPGTAAVHRGAKGARYRREGREVVEYIPGEVPWPAAHRRLLGSVESVARMGLFYEPFTTPSPTSIPATDAIWQFPEMVADAMAYADERGLIICHNDPTAWNLVINDERWAFIDWDAAGPRPAIWDVAYCAIGVIPISPDTAEAGLAWSGSCGRAARGSGRGLSTRKPATGSDCRGVIVARIRSSYQHLRRRAAAGMAPWDTLWRSGHGESWARMLDFAETYAPSWVAGLAS